MYGKKDTVMMKKRCDSNDGVVVMGGRLLEPTNREDGYTLYITVYLL